MENQKKKKKKKQKQTNKKKLDLILDQNASSLY